MLHCKHYTNDLLHILFSGAIVQVLHFISVLIVIIENEAVCVRQWTQLVKKYNTWDSINSVSYMKFLFKESIL